MNYDVVVETAQAELVAAIRATARISEIARTWKSTVIGRTIRLCSRRRSNICWPDVFPQQGLLLLVSLSYSGDALGVGGEGRDAGALDLQ
jgi:hypothetical protein